MNVGPAEILVVLVVALIAVGPTRLPAIARQVGGGVRDLRRLQQSVLHGLDEHVGDPAPAARAPGDDRDAT